MLSPFIEACGDGKYRLISARTDNQNKESLHKSLAGLLDTDAIFPERDENFWQKLENRATEEHIRVQFHNPEHTIRDDLRKYLGVLEKRSATVMFVRLHMPVRPESFILIN